MMRNTNCVQCTFKERWRGHSAGVTVDLTPARAIELCGQKVVTITSTGQTILADLGYSVPMAKPAAKTKKEKPEKPKPFRSTAEAGEKPSDDATADK